MGVDRQTILRGTVAGLLLTWFVLLLVYFFRSNVPLYFQDEAGFGGVFRWLGGAWYFSLGNTPPAELVQALLVTALTHGFGLLALRALRVPLPPLVLHALAYPVGFGLSGIAFVLLTMAGLLYTVPSWILWGVLLGGAFAFARRARPAEPEPLPPLPERRRARVFPLAALALAGLISLAILWHGIFYPETYWDSLILYLGYARMTFLEHAFPFKAEVQVGIGLGANYPHLYSNYGAMASTLFGTWSDLHQRLAAPLAGFFSCALVYLTVLRLWKDHGLAAAAALLFRAVPNGIAYHTYASDYAFALLFCAWFCLAAVEYARRPQERPLLVLLTLCPAVAMHLNFLMGILWVPWGVLVLAVEWRRRGALPRVLRDGALYAIFLAGVLLASPWYLRNLALTSNPVYAFFPEIFTGSVRMNVQVLRSAELEWFRNGDGIGRVAELYHDFASGQPRRDTGAADFRRQARLQDRLAASFLYWVGFDFVQADDQGRVRFSQWPARVQHLLRVTQPEEDRPPTPQGLFHFRWQHAYKMAPLFPGLFLPALFLLPLLLFLERDRLGFAEFAALGALAVLALGLFLYQYLLADFYLYQSIGILGPATVVAVAALAVVWRFAALRRIAQAAILVQGLVPGLAFGLVNFKFTGAREVDGQFFHQLHLDAFRSPGMPAELFLRLRFGEDVDMWNHLNGNLRGERLLTHENRHYVLDPSITLVHLDDWEIQQAWGIDDPAALRTYLLERGLRHYLRVPNEANHPILARLRLDLLEKAGMLREVFRAGGNVLYRLE